MFPLAALSYVSHRQSSQSKPSQVLHKLAETNARFKRHERRANLSDRFAVYLPSKKTASILRPFSLFEHSLRLDKSGVIYMPANISFFINWFSVGNCP